MKIDLKYNTRDKVLVPYKGTIKKATIIAITVCEQIGISPTIEYSVEVIMFKDKDHEVTEFTTVRTVLDLEDCNNLYKLIEEK
jgi:hypothetical protein